MFITMRESKGFTLVELMIVVAIVGVLAAVAVPYYQRYIQKSRLASLVFPGVHVIENNLATYYAFQPTLPFPTGTTFNAQLTDADMTYFTASPAGSTVNFVINAGATSPLNTLNGMTLNAHPLTSGGKITGWQLNGSLAVILGLQNER